MSMYCTVLWMSWKDPEAEHFFESHLSRLVSFNELCVHVPKEFSMWNDVERSPLRRSSWNWLDSGWVEKIRKLIKLNVDLDKPIFSVRSRNYHYHLLNRFGEFFLTGYWQAEPRAVPRQMVYIACTGRIAFCAHNDRSTVRTTPPWRWLH